MTPRPDLAAELADTEGEPEDEHASIPPGHMPDDHTGRLVRVEDAWRQRLVSGEKRRGKGYDIVVLPVAANVTTILRHHNLWAGCVIYDEFRDCTVTSRPPPWDPEDAPEIHDEGPWSDGDTGRLVNWLVRAEHLNVPVCEVERGLAVAADMCRRHPVREYLRTCREAWDGEPRVDRWLAHYLGTSDGEYERGVGARWLISAVARIVVPGEQVDCTLLLEGPQGIGKTSALRGLVPVAEWYADSGLDLSNKDSLDALRAVWIYGLDELDSLRKGETTRWKTFLSQTRDHYRPPYARRTRDFARQCVFAGTTNERQYLVDSTGGRRFWPVRCGRVDVEALRRDRDQLWGEACQRYVDGERWYADTPRLRCLCEEQQEERAQVHPWEDLVTRWLDKPMARGADGFPELVDVSQGVSTTDVLIHACGVARERLSKSAETQVGTILRGLGYEAVRRDGRRLYVRPADEGDATGDGEQRASEAASAAAHSA